MYSTRRGGQLRRGVLVTGALAVRLAFDPGHLQVPAHYPPVTSSLQTAKSESSSSITFTSGPLRTRLHLYHRLPTKGLLRSSRDRWSSSVNPFPPPGIRLGAVRRRRSTVTAVQDAPVGPRVRRMASRVRLFTLYNFHTGSFGGVTENYRVRYRNICHSTWRPWRTLGRRTMSR